MYSPVPIASAGLAISLNLDRLQEGSDFDNAQLQRLIALSGSLNPSDSYADTRGVLGQVLGHMSFPGSSPQDAVEYGGRKGKDWMNLLEIQSVGSMMWSDCGMLNVLIRRDAGEMRLLEALRVRVFRLNASGAFHDRIVHLH